MDTETVSRSRRLGCSGCGASWRELGTPCWFAVRLGPANRSFLCPGCANRELAGPDGPDVCRVVYDESEGRDAQV